MHVLDAPQLHQNLFRIAAQERQTTDIQHGPRYLRFAILCHQLSSQRHNEEMEDLMKHANALLALALVLSVGANVPARAQAAATTDGSTELTVSVENSSVKVGDTFTLYISMKNMHKDEYCYEVIGETGKAELNGFIAEVTDSEGHILPKIKQPYPRAWSESRQCIRHGKAISEFMNVGRLRDMSNPGVYRIRVSHLDKMTNEIVWSNSITVTITQ